MRDVDKSGCNESINFQRMPGANESKSESEDRSTRIDRKNIESNPESNAILMLVSDPLERRRRQPLRTYIPPRSEFRF
jgi:hypothetical protein